MYEKNTVGSATCAGQARDKSAIEQSLDSLEMNLEIAGENLTELIGRMQPVCAPGEPKSTSSEKGLASPSSCPIGDRITRASIRVGDLADRIVQHTGTLCI